MGPVTQRVRGLRVLRTGKTRFKELKVVGGNNHSAESASR